MRGALTLIGVLLVAAATVGVGPASAGVGVGADGVTGPVDTAADGVTGPVDTAAVAANQSVGTAADAFLQGSVRTADNEPVENATVRVAGANYTETFANATGPDGGYTVRVPPSGDGDYRVEVIEPGFRTFSTAVAVGAGETARIDATLVRREPVAALCVKPERDVALVGETVAVRVIAFAGRTRDSPRVPGVTVSLSTDDPTVRIVGPSVGTTDADGVARFEITADEPARANLSATVVDDGFTVTDGSVSLAPDSGTVDVSVRNASGSPVPGAEVRLDGPPAGNGSTVVETTDGGGAMRAGVPVTTGAGYDVTVSAPGYATATVSNVTVGPGERVDLDVTLVEPDSAASTAFPTGVPGTDGGPPVDVDGDGVFEDVTGDGAVDLRDATTLLFADLAAINADPAQRAALDVDGSGTVDFGDVVELLFAT